MDVIYINKLLKNFKESIYESKLGIELAKILRIEQLLIKTFYNSQKFGKGVPHKKTFLSILQNLWILLVNLSYKQSQLSTP